MERVDTVCGGGSSVWAAGEILQLGKTVIRDWRNCEWRSTRMGRSTIIWRNRRGLAEVERAALQILGKGRMLLVLLLGLLVLEWVCGWIKVILMKSELRHRGGEIGGSLDGRRTISSRFKRMTRHIGLMIHVE